MSDPTNASLIPAEDVLVYEGKVHISFRNSTYQWVDIKLFGLPDEPISDHEALQLLLRHVRYRDSYAGSGDKPAIGIHGPYRLDAISTQSFTAARC